MGLLDNEDYENNTVNNNEDDLESVVPYGRPPESDSDSDSDTVYNSEDELSPTTRSQISEEMTKWKERLRYVAERKEPSRTTLLNIFIEDQDPDKKLKTEEIEALKFYILSKNIEEIKKCLAEQEDFLSFLEDVVITYYKKIPVESRKSIIRSKRFRRTSSISTMTEWKRDLLAIKRTATDSGLRRDRLLKTIKEPKKLSKEEREQYSEALKSYIERTDKEDRKQSVKEHKGDLFSFLQEVVMPNSETEKQGHKVEKHRAIAERKPKAKLSPKEKDEKAKKAEEAEKEQELIKKYGHLFSDTEENKAQWKTKLFEMRKLDANVDLQLLFKYHFPKKIYDQDRTKIALERYMQNRSPEELKSDLEKRAKNNDFESFLIYVKSRRSLEFAVYAMQHPENKNLKNEELTNEQITEQLTKRIKAVMQLYGTPAKGQSLFDYLKQTDSLAAFIVERYRENPKALLDINNLKCLVDEMEKEKEKSTETALNEVKQGSLSNPSSTTSNSNTSTCNRKSSTRNSNANKSNGWSRFASISFRKNSNAKKHSISSKSSLRRSKRRGGPKANTT